METASSCGIDSLQKKNRKKGTRQTGASPLSVLLYSPAAAVSYTHLAGFSGNDSYYEAILTQVKELIDPSNRILGSFLCQGKMPAPVRRRYEELLRQNPGDSNVRQLLENFDRAADHPNAADCEALLRCVEQLSLIHI